MSKDNICISDTKMIFCTMYYIVVVADVQNSPCHLVVTLCSILLQNWHCLSKTVMCGTVVCGFCTVWVCSVGLLSDNPTDTHAVQKWRPYTSHHTHIRLAMHNTQFTWAECWNSGKHLLLTAKRFKT